MLFASPILTFLIPKLFFNGLKKQHQLCLRDTQPFYRSGALGDLKELKRIRRQLTLATQSQIVLIWVPFGACVILKVGLNKGD